jgi:hypothetical protein
VYPGGGPVCSRVDRPSLVSRLPGTCRLLTTRDLNQATEWAARKFGSEAAVLHFSVPVDALCGLDGLSFDADSPDLGDSLQEMRGGGSYSYEMVEGPMLGNPGAFMKGAAPDLWGNQVAFFGERAASMLDQSLVGIVP